MLIRIDSSSTDTGTGTGIYRYKNTVARVRSSLSKMFRLVYIDGRCSMIKAKKVCENGK